MKDLISFTCGDASLKLKSVICKFVDLIRSGKVLRGILPIFCGASLTALVKKNKDVRSIAVGLCWRRLACKIACFDVKDDLARSLSPIQNGVAVRGGSEAIIHSVRAFVRAENTQPMTIVKYDFRNAFNEMFRKFLLNEIKSEAPSLQ